MTNLTNAEIKILDLAKKQFDYNQITGQFTRKYTTKQFLKGSIAGTKCKNDYIRIYINGRQYPAHRLAWLFVYGDFDKPFIDHIDHDKTNNAINNLRCVTHQENKQNGVLQKNNTSGIMGVVYHTKYNKFMAKIKVDMKYIYLGFYSNFFDACCARKSAEFSYGFHENHGVK